MHPQGFIDQSPDALRLTLVEGSLNREQFTLFASDAFETRWIRVEATLIGASHIVTFTSEFFVLHEVFACDSPADVPGWTLNQLINFPVVRQLPEGTRYEFSVRHANWQDPEPPALKVLITFAESFRNLSDRLGVIQEFPADELPVAPKTVIIGSVDAWNRPGVIIETAHSYPNVQGLVLSRSTIHYA